MQTVGIISEYNPFHNGHDHQVQEIKRSLQPDAIVAVMSGSFLQRGEPALLDKWTRTKLALASGIDVVIELPFRFAVSAAHEFAYGGVATLAQTGVDAISFGSENGQSTSFQQAAEQYVVSEEAIQQKARTLLETGISYPRAFNEAFQQAVDTELLISEPNNSLGFHYAVANEKLGRPLDIHTVLRKQAHYHDPALYDTIASATAIRRALFQKEQENIEHVVPKSTFDTLQQYEQHTTRFGKWDHFYPFLRFLLLRNAPETLGSTFLMREGIEHRMVAAASECETFASFMQFVKTKRFTWTAIQRMLVHLLVGTPSDPPHTIQYARVLGFSDIGREWLKINNPKRAIPLITNVKQVSDEQLALDCRATSLYAQVMNSPNHCRSIHVDYAMPPVRL